MGRSPGQPRRAAARPGCGAAGGAGAMAACVGAGLLAPRLWRGLFGLGVYRGGVQWWLGGQPLYAFQLGHSGYGFTYPPFAAVALTPLALVSAPVAAVLLTAASTAVVLGTTWRFLAPVARRAGRRPLGAVALAVPAVLLADPVRETIAYGQLNLLLVALVLADVAAVRRGWWWAGAGTGLAAAIKLTPAIFVLYFVLTRRRRPAAVAIAAFAAVTAVAFLVSPRTSVEFWTTTLWDPSRVGHVDKTSNQSLLGLLARTAGPTRPRLVWLVLVVAVLALALWRAVRAYAEGDELVGLVLTGIAANLISPISWTHHLYWLVPAVIVLVDVAAGRPVAAVWPFRRLRRPWMPASAALAAFAVAIVSWTSLIWFLQRGDGLVHTGGALGAAGENAFVLIMLGLVVLLPARARVPAPRESAGDDAAVLAAD